MAYADTGVNTATCSGTGLPTSGCHTDGGQWYRLWSTAANLDITQVANRDPGWRCATSATGSTAR